MIPRCETLNFSEVSNGITNELNNLSLCHHILMKFLHIIDQRPDYKKILRLSYDVIITYDNRKSNLR